MRRAPGTVLWLLAHDARLAVRRVGEILPNLSASRRRLVLLAAVLVVHALAWPAAAWVARAAADPARAGLVLGGLAAFLAFAASWMLAQSLTGVTKVLYQRGDLDLLLAAPMPASSIVTARMLGLAAENFLSGGFFLLPLVHALALQGHAHWLGIYPLLAALALVGAGLGLAMALALFRLIGPRRARTLAQILAMVIGAVIALGIQALAVLPADLRGALLRSLDIAPAAGGLDRLWLPLAAAQGDLFAILSLLAPALVLFAVMVPLLGPAFTRAVLGSAGADLTPRSQPGKTRRVTFTSSLSASIRAKELKLITRDPWVLGQLFLQIVYTLPVAIILWRSGIGQANPAVAVTPSLVIIAAQMAASLAWIALSGEDAPEFMATAPVSRRTVEACKLQVIAMMVGAVVGVPLLLLALTAPLSALIALAFCAAAGASGALINLWHPSDGRRRAFMRRHAQSKLVGLFEHALLLLWAIGAAIAQMAILPALVLVALALVVLGLARRMLVARPAASRRRWWRLRRSRQMAPASA